MTNKLTTDKDMAEFFRLGLSLETCEVSQVVRWAEKVIEREEKPNHAFIELCLANTKPASAVKSLLADVPGSSTTGLPLRMLLGQCWHIASRSPNQAARLLQPLYLLVCLQDFESDIYYALVCLEDDLSLAQDKVFGSVEEVTKKFCAFLQPFASDAPTEALNR
ncbi:MAG: hypothetical protein IPK32_15710 [Verrucomicrobiaceae bacterium]|nr:hypothetical protein [Verrucomicrobiaceae bacterium]